MQKSIETLLEGVSTSNGHVYPEAESIAMVLYYASPLIDKDSVTGGHGVLENLSGYGITGHLLIALWEKTHKDPVFMLALIRHTCMTGEYPRLMSALEGVIDFPQKEYILGKVKYRLTQFNR